MSEAFLVAVEICPLCSSTRRKFTCLDCVQKGQFANSNEQNGELYVEKKEKILSLTNRKKGPFSDIETYHQKNYRNEQKKLEVFALSLKLCSLRQAVLSLQEQQDFDKKIVKSRKVNFKLHTRELAELKVKVLGFGNELKSKQTLLDEEKLKLEDVSTKLIAVRKRRVRNLLNDIFPISQRTVYREFGTPPRATIATRQISNDLILESSLTAELDLEEATKFTYEGGQWVQSSLSETEYCIVEPGLPVSGDFSKYYEWLKSHRKEIRSPDSDSDAHTHPALGIPAALSYAVQAINIVSCFLDVNLPTKLNFKDFGNPYICHKKLMDAVSKLNVNIMYLNFSQLTDPELLSPMQNVKNLDICLSAENQHLGHIGPFEVHDYDLPDIFSDSDSSAGDLHFDTESSDNDDDDDLWGEDWDSLQDLPDLPRDVSSLMSRPNSTEQSLSASATGLVTSAAASVASLWPWKRS